MIIVVSSIVTVSMNKILLRISVRDEDWIANRPIIVSNGIKMSTQRDYIP